MKLANDLAILEDPSSGLVHSFKRSVGTILFTKHYQLYVSSSVQFFSQEIIYVSGDQGMGNLQSDTNSKERRPDKHRQLHLALPSRIQHLQPMYAKQNSTSYQQSPTSESELISSRPLHHITYPCPSLHRRRAQET